jgi:RHS repeat-associated protein
MKKTILRLLALALLALTPVMALGGEEKAHPADVAEGRAARYLVTLNVEPSEGAAVSEELIRKLRVKRLPLNAQNFAGFAIVATPELARQLSADPRVESVEEQTFALGSDTTASAAASSAPFPSNPVIPERKQRATSSVVSNAPAGIPSLAPAAGVPHVSPSTSLAPSLLSATSTTGKPAAAKTSDGHGRMASEAALPCNPCSYSYDLLGNITAIGSDTYNYDALNQLTSATVAASAHTQSFSYDTYGNIKTITTDGTTATLSPDPLTNRLPSPATYDTSGNMLTYGGTDTYNWDAVNMMTRRRTTGVDEQYVYDASDERIAIIGSTTTRYTLRGTGPQILREVIDTPGTNSHSLAWSRDYVYRDGALLAELNPTYGTVHFHLDHLGSTRLMTDMSAKQLGVYNYYPFGGQVDPPADDQRVRFTGHELDFGGNGQDVLYMHAREQVPVAGRFLSVDPVLGDPSESQSWNRYAYVTNNPLRLTDPTGRDHYIEPGFTKPLSEANWSSAPPVIKATFYAEGGLLITGAGAAALEAAANAAFTTFPRTFLSLIGLEASYVGIPSSSWITTGETMSAKAAAYQSQITGHAANESYLVNGVKFDGASNTVLLEAKGPGYSRFINAATGSFKPWWRGSKTLLAQATRQVAAAEGAPIEWHIAEQSVAKQSKIYLLRTGLMA